MVDAAFVVEPLKVRDVTPATGTLVAAIVPLPEVPREPPLPITRATADVPAATEAKGRLVAFARLTADGVPRFGVVIAQLVVRQTLPVPLTEYELFHAEPLEFGMPAPG